MATYAYGCLSGEALDWFEDLDLQDKHDWGRLRPAMIKKSRTLPTRSRIKVVKSNGTTLGYVLPPKEINDSNYMNDTGRALVLDIPNVLRTQQSTSRLKMLGGPMPTVRVFGTLLKQVEQRNFIRNELISPVLAQLWSPQLLLLSFQPMMSQPQLKGDFGFAIFDQEMRGCAN
ncbi:hypothetical protein FRB94_014676 [Tulasnella sp. JGI-2019a]|nr:hypothetical protein FRB94_014676 [Tulasnella sp. JGI-2019a]